METFCYETKEGVTYGYFPVLREMGFENAFTCMEGGESAILPHTLNMALHVGDEAALVIRNREKAARALSISLDRTVTCAQIHGSQIAVVDAAQAGRGARDFGTTLAGVDGLASGEKDLPLMLFYADCTPIMIVDPVQKGAALLHVGWRGTVGAIGPKAVSVMKETFHSQPRDLVAAIGPSIGPKDYEVDDRVRNAAPGYEAFFIQTRPHHYLMDLWHLNAAMLQKAGIPTNQIYLAGVSTFSSDHYFSYRRDHGRTGSLLPFYFNVEGKTRKEMLCMLSEKLASVQKKIDEALALRKEKKVTGDTVTILAVTKNHPPEVVTEALDAGLTEIGENRVQEAMHKQEVLPKRGHWHLIGHLQTNKAKHAVEHFDLIESADSAKILTHLDRAAEQVGKVQDVLLQINEAGESQKSGFQPADFRAIVKTLDDYPHLRVRGVMVIAQATDQVEETRPVFRAGYEDFLFLRDALKHEDVNILPWA